MLACAQQPLPLLWTCGMMTTPKAYGLKLCDVGFAFALAEARSRRDHTLSGIGGLSACRPRDIERLMRPTEE